MADFQPPCEVLQSRVAALRKLAAQDVVPAVQEICQLCAASAEVELRRPVVGPGRFVGYTKPVRLRFEAAPDAGLRVSEAAVVLGATMLNQPAATWRGAQALELGCGSGYVGVLLAALGAHVALSDLPHLAGAATASLAVNAAAIRAGGSASFYALDWAQPRSTLEGSSPSSALARASVVVASDPVDSAEGQKAFVGMAKAIFGLDGEPPLCRNIRLFLVAHKHQQNFCICGYAAPAADARPTITHAEERERCTLRRSLEDEGLTVSVWQQPPKEFAHPFVELWAVSQSGGEPRVRCDRMLTMGIR